MACFRSPYVLLMFLVSLSVQILAVPIPEKGQMASDTTQPQIHAPGTPAMQAAGEHLPGSTLLSSATTSTSSETTNVLSGNKLQGIGNVAGNNLLSNNNGNNLVGDVNLLGEQSNSDDRTTTTTTLIDSANGGKGH